MLIEQVNANKRRSALLVTLFVLAVACVAAVGNIVLGGGPAGLLACGALAAAVAVVAYRSSGAVALAVSHARPADAREHARLHNVVEGLCVAAGLPKPAVYVIDDDALNAFATGRDPRHAAVAVTTGMLEKLSRIELEGVLAHELSHVKSLDILVSTVAVTTVGFVPLASDWALRFRRWGGPRHRDERREGGPGLAALLAAPALALLLLAPVAARLMRLVVGRRREAAADVMGVSLTRYPPGLISALDKLRAGPTVVHSASPATAHLWIESPMAREPADSRVAWLGRLFDAHPPLEERIQALREL